MKSTLFSARWRGQKYKKLFAITWNFFFPPLGLVYLLACCLFLPKKLGSEKFKFAETHRKIRRSKLFPEFIACVLFFACINFTVHVLFMFNKDALLFIVQWEKQILRFKFWRCFGSRYEQKLHGYYATVKGRDDS
jgi:hypothetical protein